MGKAARNRTIRKLAMGDKSAARRIRRNRRHDVIPLETILSGSLQRRSKKSGIEIAKTQILLPGDQPIPKIQIVND